MTRKPPAHIDAARRWLALALEVVASLGFLVMCISIILQVVFRYILQLIAPWTEELARFACIWAVFLGAAVCFEERAHIKIDFVVGKLSGTLARRLLLLFHLAVTSTFILVAFYGSILLLRVSWADTATTVPIQMGFVYLALPLSLGAIAAFGILRCVAAVCGAKERTEVKG